MARARCNGCAGDGRLCDPERHVPDLPAANVATAELLAPVGILGQPFLVQWAAVALGRTAVIVEWPAVRHGRARFAVA